MTEKKYTLEQVKDMLYQYQKQAASVFTESNRKVEERLKKAGIPLNEFTAYVIKREMQDSFRQEQQGV